MIVNVDLFGGRYFRQTGHGQVNIDIVETVTDFIDSINSQLIIRLFDRLKAKHRDAKVIHVIVDNAKYYKLQLMKD